MDKLLKDVKFLEQVKRFALMHKDDAIPEKAAEYYQVMMFSRGMVDALVARGYKIEKDIK